MDRSGLVQTSHPYKKGESPTQFLKATESQQKGIGTEKKKRKGEEKLN
jgi:hypothetical protein